MERLILEFVIGFIFVGIIPAIMIGQLQKGAVFSKRILISREIFSVFVLIIFVILSIIKENSEILMGILMGSSLFQLLAISGINKLLIPEDGKKQFSLLHLIQKNRKGFQTMEKQGIVHERSSIHYLIFCIILLLFLSADYLLRKNSNQNILSQMDGGILILLFILFLYTMQKEEEAGVFQKLRLLFQSQREIEEQNRLYEEEKNKVKYFYEKLFCYLILMFFVTIGGIFLIGSLSKIGIEFGISQYSIGLTGIVWSMNLSNILLSIFDNYQKSDRINKNSNRNLLMESDYFEKTANRIVLFFTFILGMAIIIRPINITNYIVYDLIFYAITLLFVWLIKKIDNRLAGSSLTTVYIVFVVSALIR